MRHMALVALLVVAGACTPRLPKPDASLAITCIPRITSGLTHGDYAVDESGHQVETGKLWARLELPHGGKTFVYDGLFPPFQITEGNVYTFTVDPASKTIQRVRDSSSRLVWERGKTEQGVLKLIEERMAAEPAHPRDAAGPRP